MVPYVNLRPLHEPFVEEFRDIIEAQLTNSSFILGPSVERFEEAWAKFCGEKFAVGVGSGTDAIHLALRAVGVREGSEVVTVANSAEGTVIGIRQARGKPVYCDVDDQGLLDVSKLEACITPNTKAIVPVCLYGRPFPVSSIRETYPYRMIPVVLDACQAHGASTVQGPVGYGAAATCWSFYPTKNLGALGDGGAVTTDSQVIAKLVSYSRNYGRVGRDEQAWPGINSRLDTIQAAFLLAKFPHLRGWNSLREMSVELYRELLEPVPDAETLLPRGGENHHIFAIRTSRRDLLQKYLGRRGIVAFPHYPIPAHLQGANQDDAYPEGSLPKTEAWCRSVLSLPLWVGISPASIREVVQAIDDFVRGE